ncbi:DUF6179 domain-containing protein [Sporosarcina sp. Te-1]|uniref:DUF6179 domain-containing protein n=1 Tax=Sporosarcina sp. Te-1 TaxID=2818390 RepID=UPI001A9FB07A|nr:DUF6179 domain-containing protein [Sporosarcina sp. Te-1]QTD40367.1 hypothetical protein J3U78_16515 [Sporosarcina sp. Te-1]
MELNHAQNRSQSVSAITINRSRLKQSQYTLTLLKEGQRAGLISSKEVYRIQVEIMQVLQQLIREYTKGESTSVTSDTAQGILASLMYAIDAYALHFREPEDAITHLGTKSVKNIHSKGIELLQQYFEEAKQLYRTIKSMRLDVPVDAYNMTIDESLPVFMNNYDIVFEGQNTMASIDYPLAVDDMKLQGVFYMKQYVERFLMETKFCHFFLHQDVLYVLKNFGKKMRFNYSIELFNIFELILNNAVFSVLSGGRANQIRISDVQYNELDQLFMSCDADKRSKLVHEAFDRIQVELEIDQELIAYINLYRDELVQRVNISAEIGSFDKLIIKEEKEHEKSIVLLLHENDRMNDMKMRELIDRIMKSDTNSDKVRLIRENVVSLHDYLDLLNSECLYGDEYDVLFAAFWDIELAVFSKIVFYEELRGDVRDFSEIVAGGTEAREEWESRYVEFMQQLDEERIKAIGHLIYNIDYEEISFY